MSVWCVYSWNLRIDFEPSTRSLVRLLFRLTLSGRYIRGERETRQTLSPLQRSLFFSSRLGNQGNKVPRGWGEGKPDKYPPATTTWHYFKPGFTVVKVSKVPCLAGLGFWVANWNFFGRRVWYRPSWETYMEHFSVTFLRGNWSDEAQTRPRPGQISSWSDAGGKSNLKINLLF